MPNDKTKIIDIPANNSYEKHAWIKQKKKKNCRNTYINPSFSDSKTVSIYCRVDRDFQSSEEPGRVAQSVGHLSRKSEVLGSIPSLATYFRFSFR